MVNKKPQAVCFCFIVACLFFTSCGGSDYVTKYRKFENENKKFYKNQIVFIGDSITDGYNLKKHFSFLLLKTYNRGISRDTTDGVLKRLNVSLYDIKPSIVVILIGINDIKRDIDHDTIIQNYTAIFEGISTNLPDTKVVIQSVYPVDIRMTNDTLKLTKTIEYIINLNAHLKLLCDEYNFIYADIFERLKNNDNTLIQEYSYDGLHLNHNGYMRVSVALLDIIYTLIDNMNNNALLRCGYSEIAPTPA